jgi:hypothetical protein
LGQVGPAGIVEKVRKRRGGSSSGGQKNRGDQQMLTTSFANFTHSRKRLRPSIVPPFGEFFSNHPAQGDNPLSPPIDNFSLLFKKDELIEGKVSIINQENCFP